MAKTGKSHAWWLSRGYWKPVRPEAGWSLRANAAAILRRWSWLHSRILLTTSVDLRLIGCSGGVVLRRRGRCTGSQEGRTLELTQ